MSLKGNFTSLLRKIGFETSKIEALWNNLEKVYSHKKRFYHNLTHLEEMVVLYDFYSSQLQFPDEVLFSIFYHDYIYKVTSNENELKSAEYAIALLKSHHKLNKKLVFDMIVATKLHEHNTIEDINWLIDFDLKILSKDWKYYEMYSKEIRKEYKIYPDILYNPGRKKALQHFLENEHIYQTETFRRLYEKQARENIQNEIDCL